MEGKFYFDQSHSDPYKKSLKQTLSIYFISWQHTVTFGERAFSTNNCHSPGNQLCPCTCRLFFYSSEAHFWGTSEEERKDACLHFNFTFRYTDYFLSLNTFLTSNMRWSIQQTQLTKVTVKLAIFVDFLK